MATSPKQGSRSPQSGPQKKATKKKASSGQRRWVSKVKTESTYPSEGLFTKDPETIARQLASKKVSPKGPGSGMRMLTYFINRAGKGLSATRRKKLERAKALLSERVRNAREKERKRAA
jgi:tRNA(adenine34) deaminase